MCDTSFTPHTQDCPRERGGDSTLPDNMTMCATWVFLLLFVCLFFCLFLTMTCKVAWAVQVSQTRVTGLAISRAQITEACSVLTIHLIQKWPPF